MKLTFSGGCNIGGGLSVEHVGDVHGCVRCWYSLRSMEAYVTLLEVDGRDTAIVGQGVFVA